MTLLKSLAALAGVCIFAAIAFPAVYREAYPTYAVRYELAVSVFSGGTQHRGSSVTEVLIKTQPNLLDIPKWAFNIDGAATFVDLGGGFNLVAPLTPGPSKGSDAIGVVFRAFGVPFLVKNASELKNLKGQRSLNQADWPAFVTFRNVGDPLSLESVNPQELESAFGPGTRIESVTLTITDDPITRNLAEFLPWLSKPLSRKQIFAFAKRHFSRRDFERNDR